MSTMSTPSTPHTMSHVKVPHEKIAMRAYDKWCQRGRQHGTHVQDWLDAERELQGEHSRSLFTRR